MITFSFLRALYHSSIESLLYTYRVFFFFCSSLLSFSSFCCCCCFFCVFPLCICVCFLFCFWGFFFFSFFSFNLCLCFFANIWKFLFVLHLLQRGSYCCTLHRVAAFVYSLYLLTDLIWSVSLFPLLCFFPFVYLKGFLFLVVLFCFLGFLFCWGGGCRFFFCFFLGFCFVF